MVSGGSRISQKRVRQPLKWGGGANRLFDQFFPKNCMKMKEIGLGGGGARPCRIPLDPPMMVVNQSIVNSQNLLIYNQNIGDHPHS